MDEKIDETTPKGISEMSGSLNKVMLIGHVGKDPEMRSMQDGKRMANFSLATSESWRDTAIRSIPQCAHPALDRAGLLERPIWGDVETSAFGSTPSWLVIVPNRVETV